MLGLIAGIAMGGAAFFVTGAMTIKSVETGKEIYQVTVSDNINFNEFMNTYNIIKQDGLIYTIIEK